MHTNEVNIHQEKWNATVESALSAALDAIADTQEDWMTGYNAFYDSWTEHGKLDDQLDGGLNAVCKDSEQYQLAWRVFHDHLPEPEHHRSTFMDKLKSVPGLFRSKK